jgi:hypothetical protein
VDADGDEPSALQRLFAEETDARTDPAIANAILEFVRDHATKSVIMAD